MSTTPTNLLELSKKYQLTPINIGLFYEALNIATETPDLIEQYNRIMGKRFLKPVSPIETMIDEHTGYDEFQLIEFLDFFGNAVWSRYDWTINLPEDKKEELIALHKQGLQYLK